MQVTDIIADDSALNSEFQSIYIVDSNEETLMFTWTFVL